jgi:ATP-dependent DNA helicase RecG
METVCSYANEPGLGGGYILMGISADDSAPEPFQYKVDPMPNPDKLQSDLATQCAGMFNIPVRPKITMEKINGQAALKIWVDELPPKLKPLYFKKDKLPYGALRRIGSTDQHWTPAATTKHLLKEQLLPMWMKTHWSVTVCCVKK